MNRQYSWALSILSMGMLVGCHQAPLTQLVVAIDSDLEIPSNLDRVELLIEAPDGERRQSVGELSGDAAVPLPLSLGLLHRGGPLGPISIVARGLLGNDEVVIRHASASFIEQRTLILEMHLSRACIGVACDADETCELGECRSRVISESELKDYVGQIPRLSGDGGINCLNIELCNGIDDDCDEHIDEGIDLMTNPRHCGRCGNVCPNFAGSRPICVRGECAIECVDGLGDCDGEPRTGCETPLDSPTDCGACTQECTVSHGIPSCFAQTCTVETCAPGFGDCNGMAEDGCEARLDSITNCGRCDTPCAPLNAIPGCAGGTCRYVTCESGFGDCDSDTTTGCETPLNTTNHCGGCMRACPTLDHAEAACMAGQCAIGRCESGFGDCNSMALDGCETRLDSLASCGACGRSCSLAHASEQCQDGTCALVACDPGWGDCDGLASTGCETNLLTASNCGRCRNVCSAPTPICGADSRGIGTCQSACAPNETLCGTACVTLATNIAHCGQCDRPCVPNHASGMCVDGSCRIAACDPGFGDCNANPADGCETRLDTVMNCGACNRVCTLSEATASCAFGTCGISSCETGFGDCDRVASNGCETPLDSLTACGACDTPCSLDHAEETCGTGTCSIVRCEAGWGDCDGMAQNGCETSLNSLTTCGTCTGMCDLARASESCATGMCVLVSCESGFGNCDGMDSNGCEQSLRTSSHCLACNVRCGPFPNASASCASGGCEMTCSAGYGDCLTEEAGCETALNTMMNCAGCGVACPTPDNTTTSCSDGTCRIIGCTQGNRADCNGMVADGCEVHLLTDPQNCGTCGHACEQEQRCRGGMCE